MRARRKWNTNADVVKYQGWITVFHDGRPVPRKGLESDLAHRENETLLTSLNQKERPIRGSGPLYFKHWAVEAEYDLLKSKLQLENFSGKTKTTVLQDFYATRYLANLTAFLYGQADENIALADAEKNLLYLPRANHNRAIVKLKEHFLDFLLEPNISVRRHLLDRLAQIARRPESIAPGRSPSRKCPRKKRFHLSKNLSQS